MLGLRFRPIIENLDFLAGGIGTTFFVSVVGFFLGTFIAIFIAFGRRSGLVLPRYSSSAFIEAIRNTPFLVHIYFIYFGLGSLGINIPALPALIIALVLMNAGYMAEIIRGGFEAIKEEQIKSAKSLGMSTWQLNRYIVVPPALRTILPSALNQFAITFVASSLGVVIGVKEITWRADFLQARNFLSLESYLVAAAFYVIVVKFTLVASRFIDNRLFDYKIKDI